MDWLNYHHLKYFWVVAREGTITSASKILHLSPSTISEQLHLLEDSMGQQLFRRSGRRLVLTDVGHIVLRYADSIFSTGQELMDFVQGRPTGGPVRLDVGIADVVPKLVVQQLLRPAFALKESIHLICRQGEPDQLVADLALHHLDVVISDAPVGAELPVKAFNHLLGQCGMSLVGTHALVARYRADFPKSLDGAPFLLPTANTVARRHLDQWFDRAGVHPEIVAEFEDSAVLKVFGASGYGLFAVPDIIIPEVCAQYHVEVLGPMQGVIERFYAISVERQLKHPAVLAICEAARSHIFHERAAKESA